MRKNNEHSWLRRSRTACKAIHWTWSDEIIKDPNRDACLIGDGEWYSPSQFNAPVLGKIKETDEAHQGSVQQAALTILVYRRDAQRQATRDVGKDLRFGGSAHHQRNDSLHSLPAWRTWTVARQKVRSSR